MPAVSRSCLLLLSHSPTSTGALQCAAASPTSHHTPLPLSHCRLHSRGIQVILDVVYNHTAELDDKHPYTISMRCVWLRVALCAVGSACAVSQVDMWSGGVSDVDSPLHPQSGSRHQFGLAPWKSLTSSHPLLHHMPPSSAASTQQPTTWSTRPSTCSCSITVAVVTLLMPTIRLSSHSSLTHWCSMSKSTMLMASALIWQAACAEVRGLGKERSAFACSALLRCSV
jgi:hypothetical protein